MPKKNKFGGNKAKKGANKRNFSNTKRGLRRPEEDQEIAKVGKHNALPMTLVWTN